MLFDVRVDVFEEVILFDTDDELAWVPAQCCLVIADFHFDGGGIALIESGDDLQQGCCVINALGHGADVVQSPRQREASVVCTQAMVWFQTDESTGGRRNTDRTSGVCTECGKGHLGCKRSAGATRGSARYFIEIPWIMDRAK